MTDRYYVVTSWEDIAAAAAPNDRDKQRVATIFSEKAFNCVVWLPEWLLDADDKDIETVEASDHLAVGGATDYSEKAWEFAQPHRDGAGGYLPKSSVTLFERGDGVESIETPQRGLTSFEGAQSDD
ncbi:hypothetical protein C470_03611 [Halorubrum distributum JCM 13561]|uniref:Uncharacterized protein n=1 Tax=Halorubrum distributum JCM 13561 TaxID=1227483 RepID=M0P034_9EURY|nr:hypothetical protein [Halorubrum litoreum]EMA63183.1 hypothetical protein C470_03611 [Halorubrum litoreum JCM 13561]